MSDFEAEFIKLRDRMNDAFDNHFIDGDALDRIGVTMCLLFVEEARIKSRYGFWASRLVE